MLYRAGNRWALCPYKVTYTQNGETFEKYTHDPQAWRDFADRWAHTEIQSVEEVDYSDAEKERAKEVRRIPDGFQSDVVNYVKNGKFPEGVNHPLLKLKNTKRIEELEKRLEAFENNGKGGE